MTRRLFRVCGPVVAQFRCIRSRRVHDEIPREGTKALQVAIIGAPNVGKSLLSNQVVKAAVSAVSSCMDTTTKNVVCALTEEEVQLVVVDSPGTVGVTHAKKHSGQKDIVAEPEAALANAHHIVVVQDATALGDYIHHRVIHLLHRHSHLPSTLVMNKVDLVTQRSDLLQLTRILTRNQVAGRPIQTIQRPIGNLGRAGDCRANTMKLHGDWLAEKTPEWQAKYRALVATPSARAGFAETRRLFLSEPGWPSFSAVFFCSALTGEGIDDLRRHLLSLAQDSPWRLPDSAVTTKSPQSICEDSVRAALLDCAPSYLAYSMRPKVSEWVEDGEVLQVVVDVECAKEREARAILGKGGARISEVGQRVNDHMSTLFQRQLFVRILVKVEGKVYEQ